MRFNSNGLHSCVFPWTGAAANQLVLQGSDAAKSLLDSFLFFMFYEWFRSIRTHKRWSAGKGGLGVLEELTVGVAAGACSRAVTTPIANVVTRKQTASMVAEEVEKGVGDIARGIKHDKGLGGLWSGYSASLLLSLNPSITFFLQDFLKKNVISEKKRHDPGAFLTFLVAATSKAVASTITYPFQTAKARLQAGASNGEDEDDEDLISLEERDVDYEVEKKLRAARAVRRAARRSVFGMLTHIVRTEGVGALYDGLLGELLKGFLSHGLTMVAKEAIHKMLFRFYLSLAAMLHKYQDRLYSLRARFSRNSRVDATSYSRTTATTVTEDVLVPRGQSSAVSSHIQTHPLIPAPVSTRELAPMSSVEPPTREPPTWTPAPAPTPAPVPERETQSWAPSSPAPAPPALSRSRAPPPPPLALREPKMLEQGHREPVPWSPPSDHRRDPHPGTPMQSPLPPALQYRIDTPLAGRRRAPQPVQRYIMNMIDKSHRDLE